MLALPKNTNLDRNFRKYPLIIYFSKKKILFFIRLGSIGDRTPCNGKKGRKKTGDHAIKMCRGSVWALRWCGAALRKNCSANDVSHSSGKMRRHPLSLLRIDYRDLDRYSPISPMLYIDRGQSIDSRIDPAAVAMPKILG